MIWMFLHSLFSKNSAMQTARPRNLSRVPSLETAMQNTLHGAYFVSCDIIFNIYEITQKTENIVLFLQLGAINYLPKALKVIKIILQNTFQTSLDVCCITIPLYVMRCENVKKQCDCNQSRRGRSVKIKYLLINWLLIQNSGLKLTIIIFNKAWWQWPCYHGEQRVNMIRTDWQRF